MILDKGFHVFVLAARLECHNPLFPPFRLLSVERVGMSCAGNGQKRRYRGAPMGRIQVAKKQTLPK